MWLIHGIPKHLKKYKTVCLLNTMSPKHVQFSQRGQKCQCLTQKAHRLISNSTNSQGGVCQIRDECVERFISYCVRERMLRTDETEGQDETNKPVLLRSWGHKNILPPSLFQLLMFHFAIQEVGFEFGSLHSNPVQWYCTSFISRGFQAETCPNRLCVRIM